MPTNTIPMIYCKTAVTPVQMDWSYSSLTLLYLIIDSQKLALIVSKKNMGANG